MTLETAFRRFTLLPRFIQTGNGEPRKAHYLGRDEASPIERKQDQGRKHDNAPKKPGSSKYRDLADITLGEVEEVYNHFKSQLVPSPVEAWVAKNYFCQFPLKRKGDDRPPVVLGRVKTVYPSDGYVNNIEQMEVYFPRRDAAPDLLHVRAERLPLCSGCAGADQPDRASKGGATGSGGTREEAFLRSAPFEVGVYLLQLVPQSVDGRLRQPRHVDWP